MQELKKTLLKVTEQLVNMHYEDDSVKTIILRNLRGIRKHMSGKDTGVPTNDGWIPVDERMPTQEECKDNLFWITYGYFSSSPRVAQCQWVLSYDENGNDDSYSEFYIDQAPSIYVPSQNLVTAWKIINIPEPYRLERSERK